MDSIKLWARNDGAGNQAIELGEIAHIQTTSEELTDGFICLRLTVVIEELERGLRSHAA